MINIRVTNLEFLQTCEVQFAFAHTGKFFFENAASKRGKELHSLFEHVVKGTTPLKVPAAYQPIVQAWQQWWSSKERSVLLQEERLQTKLSDEVSLTGKPDLVIQEDGVVTIVDLKTGRNPLPHLYSSQLPLYSILLFREKQIVAQKISILDTEGKTFERTLCETDIVYSLRLVDLAEALIKRNVFRKGYSCNYCDYYALCFSIPNTVLTLEDIEKLAQEEAKEV
jgi:predicted RecB family nuclease